MGTASESFIELTERIGRKTGGLSVSPSVMSRKGSDEPVAYIMVRSLVVWPFRVRDGCTGG